MRRLQDNNGQAMANRENSLNEATGSPQDEAGVRDDKVRRLGRPAGDVKDASPSTKPRRAGRQGLETGVAVRRRQRTR